MLPDGDVLVAEALQQDQPVSIGLRLCDGRDDAPRRGARRQPEPHHAAARRRRRRRRRNAPRLSRGAQPALRHGARRRHFLCRQYRWRWSRFPYEAGRDQTPGAGRKLASFKPGGHWTRSLLASPDGASIYVGVGSLTNIADKGMAAEEGRAAIHRHDVACGKTDIFASRPAQSGRPRLRADDRRAVDRRQRARRPRRRDAAGLSDVGREGGFYGWPYCYWSRIVDDRVPADPAMVAKAIQPDYALGGHTASLGLCWMPAGTLPGFPDGMVIGQHGSWNRSTLSRLSRGLRALRERQARPARRATSCPAFSRRTKPFLRPPGRRRHRPRSLAAGRRRRRRRDLAGHGRVNALRASSPLAC